MRQPRTPTADRVGISLCVIVAIGVALSMLFSCSTPASSANDRPFAVAHYKDCDIVYYQPVGFASARYFVRCDSSHVALIAP
jgi:hypothetical protein